MSNSVQQSVQSHDRQAMVLFDQNNYTKIGEDISNAYNKVIAGNQDQALVSLVSRSIDQIRSDQQKFKAEGNFAASEYLAQLVIRGEKLRNEMNTAIGSTAMNEVDASALTSFCTTPINRLYIDPDTGKTYVQGDHSKLVSQAWQYCASGGYSGYGIERHQKIQGKVCDVFYLKKHDDQIDYERRQLVPEKEPNRVFGFRNPFHFSSKSQTDSDIEEIRKRMVIQNNLLQNLKNLKKLAISHAYEKAVPCGGENLDSLGATKNDRIHALIFFYKETDAHQHFQQNSLVRV